MLCFKSWFSSQLLGIRNLFSKKKKDGLGSWISPHSNHKRDEIFGTEKIEFTFVALAI